MSFAKNPILPWLLKHAYGQGGTVAVPAEGPVGVVPLGAFPPGIEEVLTHVADRNGAWTAGSPVNWCFLIGGPGNGKSEALRSLAARLSFSLPDRVPGAPAPRTVPISWPTEGHRLPNGLEIALINDASIPRTDLPASGPRSLYLDILNAVERTKASTATSLFANVNRGVLVEEVGGLDAVANWPAEPVHRRLTADLVRWLADPMRGSGANLEIVVPVKADKPHYGQAKLSVPLDAGGELELLIHVVALDSLSLLEPSPGGDMAPVIDFSQSPPSVAPYRTIGKLVSDDLHRDEITVAGKLVTMYVDSTKWKAGGCVAADGTLCAAHDRCPFAQNARWLQESRLRRRFLDALRAAEVAAARRLSYRDLLGHVSLAIAGAPEDQWLKGMHPCEWVAGRLAPGSAKAGLVSLVRHRIYWNLYPDGGFEIPRGTAALSLSGDTVFGAIVDQLIPHPDAARVKPFESAFADLDPARDVDAWGGSRRKVLDAIEALDVVSPSVEVDAWTDAIHEMRSNLEDQLDVLLREEIALEIPRGDRTSIRRIRVLRRWRAVALLRQTGTAFGFFRHGQAVGAWLAEQASALADEPRQRLGDGLNRLIVPSGGNQNVFFAPLRPRTYCLTGKLPSHTLLVNVPANEIDVIISARGDTLAAVVQLRRRDPINLATLSVDLAVTREALLNAGDAVGSFSEIGDTAFARIERARASLVSRARMLKMHAWFTSEHGRAHQLAPTPAGAAFLRVEGT